MAVTRTDARGRPDGGWLPHERLSAAQALTAYSEGVAYQSFEERTGACSRWARADVVVLDRDVFELPPGTVAEAKVVSTWCAGERTF